ncbi:MAG: sortase [Clostridia bacterium]|nr:sortase [Clostridia bacterium]
MKDRKNIINNKKDSSNKLGGIVAVIIFGIAFYLGYGVYKENKIRLVKENSQENIQIERTSEIQTIEKKESVNIPENYLGFDVTAKLIIPKINLETYILNDYLENGMKVCASKFWGPEPNEIGNFCIAGHNYEKENMFNHLIDLEIGDELYLLDNKNGKVLYKIYDIYKVKPENVEPLNQETNGKRVVTLITCVNFSKNRLIVQAVEV